MYLCTPQDQSWTALNNHILSCYHMALAAKRQHSPRAKEMIIYNIHVQMVIHYSSVIRTDNKQSF